MQTFASTYAVCVATNLIMYLQLFQVSFVQFPMTDQGDIDAMQFVETAAQWFYVAVLSMLLLQLLNMFRHSDEHNRTSGGLLLICLLLRSVPAFLMQV